MSSKRGRKPYALAGGKRLISQGVISDFPIPNCSGCGSQMVKLEGQWGCKQCTMIETLVPVGTVSEDGRPVTKLFPVERPLGEAYPNRRARRAIR